MKIGPCPQCPESDGGRSSCRPSRWARSSHRAEDLDFRLLDREAERGRAGGVRPNLPSGTLRSGQQVSGDESKYTSLYDGGWRRSEERRVGKEGRSRWSPYH